MEIQRIRNITTGVIHTSLAHLKQDLHRLIKAPGNDAASMPDEMVEPIRLSIQHYFKAQFDDPRFFEAKLDRQHVGQVSLRPMTDPEAEIMLEYLADWFAKETKEHLEATNPGMTANVTATLLDTTDANFDSTFEAMLSDFAQPSEPGNTVVSMGFGFENADGSFTTKMKDMTTGETVESVEVAEASDTSVEVEGTATQQ